MVFRTIAEIEKYTQVACNEAVKNTCDRLLKQLKIIIRTEYYNQYDPKKYVRTDQFFNSAITKMLTDNCGVILMDESSMNYRGWAGELQLEYASRGYHGSLDIQTEGRFWDEFSEFCENNVYQILREELIKQGVPIIN
jgi:hypothetical protein